MRKCWSFLSTHGSKLAVVVMVVCLLTSCTSQRSPLEERAQALNRSSEDIKIGVAWPFETRNDFFREGLEMALDEVNQQGIWDGTKIQLIQKDDHNSVTEGMSIAQSFAEDHSISAVIGHRSSTVTIPSSQIYENAGLLLLAPAATSPKLTSSNSPLIFRNIPDDSELGRSLALYSLENHFNNIAIYYTDDEYGRGLANAFEDKAKESGLKITDRISGYKDLADLKRIADKWEALGTDLLVFAGIASDGIAVLGDLHKLNVTLPVIGGDGLDTETFAAAGKSIDGSVVASIYRPDGESEVNQAFREKFIQKYGVEPTKWAAQGYDCLHLLVDAIERAHSRLPVDIANQLHSQEAWTGTAGPRSFNSDGSTEQFPIVMKQVRNGTFQYID
ncbi:MAG: ABC transporter substrate-binding protein [Candidatus Cohnella colombiensis]|uniref:ABC transporter substrate-binding protein n=1 Tax=Candidatus Cohnella colombiensis TaxID=3121368 RepID=A0AA95EWG9_9BACL|nr:MAG: ABC transporter substrate-binding protein [Cohnella sp.]